MVKLVVDTCVWLDMAKGADQHKLLNVIEELRDLGEVTFIVPQIVIDEFERNKQRVIESGTQSLSSVFSRVNDVIKEYGDPDKRDGILKGLNDMRHKLPSLVETAAFNISRIEKILKSSIIIPTTSDVLVKAAQRAIDKKAPFHVNKSTDASKNKNNMADAVIIETYANCLSGVILEEEQFAFVTHNKSDFGDINHKNPHPDFQSFFSSPHSTYFINLVEALRHFMPELMSDIEAEQDWEDVPRSFTEISKAQSELFDKVWYNRHQNQVYKAKRGIDGVTQQDVEIGRAAAEKREKQYGKANLGPYSDFEWGMLNGKLSAIRWVMGDEWDFLDT
jgi:hypothetical protein